jgi:UDP-N-acetylglucosamine transferase subunit ALG13
VILVTVGTQLPFDRLIQAVDRIAPELDEPVFAQVGKTDYVPQHMEWVAAIAPADFERRFATASRVVAHAGIGGILTARRLGKPVILFPRRAEFGEHRNDHQLATAAHLADGRTILVAQNEDELRALLKRDLAATVRRDEAPPKLDRLTGYLRDVFHGARL